MILLSILDDEGTKQRRTRRLKRRVYRSKVKKIQYSCYYDCIILIYIII